MAEPIVPIRSTTQLFTEIEDIDHDLVLCTDGSCALVIATSAVNFGLLSEKEQEGLIYAYAGLLNSLSFPIQIFIRSQHKDVTAYLKLLEDREEKLKAKSPKLAENIHSYRTFVAAMVKEKDVLDKKFYIVIPFSNLELGTTKVLFGSKKNGLPYPKSYILERAEIVLLPKRDHIIRLLARLGLRSNQLSNDALIKLFFTIYNPGTANPEGNYEDIVEAGVKA